MGFSDARAALIDALQAVQRGELQLLHEPRDNPDKNLLERGVVSVADVIAMAKAANGGQNGRNYRPSPHHDPGWSGVTVHELLRVRWQGADWYLKWFHDDPDLWFISVHPSLSPTTTPGGNP